MHAVISFVVHVCVYILAIKVSSQLPYNQPMTVQGFSQQLIQLQGALIQRQQKLTEFSALVRKQNEILSEIWSKLEQLPDVDLPAIVRQLQSFTRNLPSRASFVNTGFSNSWYLLVNEAKTWNEAERYCQELHPNGHLAMVTSSKENSFIVALLKQQVSGSRSWAYIGGHDINVEGQWKWQNGQSMSYTNWDPGEPNNRWSREDRSDISSETGKWNDVSGTEKKPFLCQVIYPE